MWQKEYKKKKFYWGLKPTIGLGEAVEYAQKGTALDIGAGEGRNSIFLANNGFKVEAIDEVKEGLEKCKNFVEKYNLPIKTKVIDVKKFNFRKDKYSLVLSTATLDFLKFSEFKKIIKKIQRSLKKDGIFYLVVLSVKDPVFKWCKEKLKTVEKNTFYLPKFTTFRHFFSKKELLDIFKNFRIIKIKEEKMKDTHGGIHYHYLIRIIVKK